VRGEIPNLLGPLDIANLNHWKTQVKVRVRVRVRVTLRLAAYRQSVRLGDKLLKTHDQHLLTEYLLSYSLCNILSDEKMGLSFTNAADPRQCSHSQVRVPRGSCTHFTVSNLRLPQHGGPDPRIYISQEQGGPVTS
jgi:hypothetical protein